MEIEIPSRKVADEQAARDRAAIEILEGLIHHWNPATAIGVQKVLELTIPQLHKQCKLAGFEDALPTLRQLFSSRAQLASIRLALLFLSSIAHAQEMTEPEGRARGPAPA